MAKNTDTFGYTYEDIQGGEEDVFRRWDQSYRWSLRSNRLSNPPDWMKPVDVSKAQALGRTEDDGDPRVMHFPQEIPESMNEERSDMAIPDMQVPEVRTLLASYLRRRTLGSRNSLVHKIEPVVQWYIDTQVER